VPAADRYPAGRGASDQVLIMHRSDMRRFFVAFACSRLATAWRSAASDCENCARLENLLIEAACGDDGHELSFADVVPDIVDSLSNVAASARQACCPASFRSGASRR